MRWPVGKQVLPWLLAFPAGQLPLAVPGAVTAVHVEQQEQVLNGRPFGKGGPYQLLSGRIEFEFPPTHYANNRIVDLSLAPRNPRGMVAASADFMVLRPRDGCGRQCIALLEVSNRGDKAALAYFNGGSFSTRPRLPRDFGDGLLLRHGLTLIWVGWQTDVPERPGLLRLRAPIAGRAGGPLRGLARSDWTVDQHVHTLALGHRRHRPYPVADPTDARNILTVRTGRRAPRQRLPRNTWSFARRVADRLIADPGHIASHAGFLPGHIYELVYVVENPPVVGIGLAVVRDVMSYAKYRPGSLFPARTGIAFGVSQTGRFLRHFLYQGFNVDEQGRPVFDGMLIHSAGAGRGSFNHRFAQASRDAHRYSAFFYPTDLFPFTGRTQRDPFSGREDGLYKTMDPAHLPKLMYTNTGYEYWGRAASLIHTTISGDADITLLPRERIYHLASAQHFVGELGSRTATEAGGMPERGNPLDFLVNLRALLIRLIRWVVTDHEPPPSRYPRLDDGSLVAIDQVDFPPLPDVELPRVVHQAHRLHFGPRWHSGIIDLQPPRVGPAFPALVSQVDVLGNESAGVRNVELRVPVATFTPWKLRTGYAAAQQELTDFVGTFIPLACTEAERAKHEDPRPSIELLYPDRVRYHRLVRAAAGELVSEGWLLPEDMTRVQRRATRLLDHVCPAPSSDDGPPR